MTPDWKKDYARYKSFLSHLTTDYQKRSDIKLYVEMLLSLITISIFSVFALRPTLLTIAQLMKDINTKKETISVLDKKIENLAAAQTVYEQYKASINILYSAVPKTNEPDVFLRQIQGVAEKHQITVSSITLGEGVLFGTPISTISSESGKENKDMKKSYQTSPFTITATTSLENYQTLTSFVKDLESLRMPLIIDEVRVRKNAGTSAEPTQLILFVQGEVPYVPMEPSNEF